VRAAPGSPAAWTALGVRQQEAERERRALTALRRALALDPAHQPARLALAIGLTNEGARADAAAELAEWAERRAGTGAGALAAREGEGRAEHARRLIDALLDVARAEADVDADVQIALAVLLQLNEEWDKSNDCFRAALAARPEDWLLWNRVGATLANSGQPEQALEYYAQALSLNPLYIRARLDWFVLCRYSTC
jgi:peroxin-5